MEKYTFDKDLYLIGVRATSFPDGITEAFQKLGQIDPSFTNRTRYGISHGSKDGIIYRAAVEETFSGEGYTFGLEQYTIKKGVYATETLKKIMGKEERIAQAFAKLLCNPKLDRSGECIEWYKSENEVQCMVRLTE